MSVVSFAKEILKMESRIIDLEIENDRLREYEFKYHNMLNETLAHNESMVGNLLALVATPGVVDACKKAAEGLQHE
jgi:hypothetical protein